MIQVNAGSKKVILEVFKNVYSITEDAKTLTKSASDLKKKLAEGLNVKTEVINSAFSLWVKKQEKPDVVDDLDSIIEGIS